MIRIVQLGAAQRRGEGLRSGIVRSVHSPAGDSEACRSAFRSDVDHDSEMKSISIPI